MDGKCRVWWKLYFVVDMSIYEIIVVELSLFLVIDVEVLFNLFK